jgi:RimJ/RimL family protein N-acetyltransferase
MLRQAGYQRGPAQVHIDDEIMMPFERRPRKKAQMTADTLPDQFPELEAALPGLVLRPFREADAPAVAEACNDEETQRWLPLPRPYTMANALNWCTRLSCESRETGDGLVLAMVTEPGGLIGAISLTRTDWRARITEIGYWTAPRMRGAGHTSAATAYLARWALASGMERVELRAATGNSASRRVAEKAGFEFEGVMRNAGIVHGGRVDLCLYALIPGPAADRGTLA